MLPRTFLAGTLVLLVGLEVDLGAASSGDRDRGRDWGYDCDHPEVCENGGTCWLQFGDLTLCSCPVEYHGWHCESYDNCHSSPCRNGGICDNSFDTGGYYCVCREGWTGQNCETASHSTACADIDCEHDGTCYHYDGVFLCVCWGRYHGYFCEAIDGNTCNADTQCANGGTCEDDGDGRSYCHCTDEWAGDYCRDPYPVVALCDNYCENAGSCFVTEEGEPACSCAPGWTGEHCSEPAPSGMPDICGSDWDPCGDNGQCFSDADYSMGFHCSCHSGYEGSFCQHFTGVSNPGAGSTDPTTDSCDTGRDRCGEHGRCKSQAGGGYSCRCDNGWTGDYCDKPLGNAADNKPQASGFPIGGIVGSIIGGLLFFVIFGAIFILRIARAGKLRQSRPPGPPPAPAPTPAIIYDPGVHGNFDGSVHGLAKPRAKDVYGSDSYQQTRIPRRYTPTPVRDHRPAGSSNVFRNPGAGTNDYAYATGSPSKARVASPATRPNPPPLMPMPGVEQNHQYAYAIDNAAYVPSPAPVGPPPAYSRSPSRAPSKARSEHTYQSIAEFAHPPSTPRSEAGARAPSVASRHSSKK